MDPNTVRDLSTRFQALMAARQQEASTQQAAAQTDSTATLPTPGPTSTTLPTIPSGRTNSSPPQSHPFYAQIQSLSHHLDRYNEPNLIDLALETIDLGKIYEEAEAAAAAAASKPPSSSSSSSTSPNDQEKLGYQDHVIKALLRWFKQDFFSWTNQPACSTCQSLTEATGISQPTATEREDGADRTELYRCTADASHTERFPRYNSPATLLRWRKGRCGEFANCFTLLCMALGSRARWVWNAEDHVWTEVYSEHLRRWVHCDPCENAWDSPLIYTVGWAKKMSYVFAFSASGARDVTRRYVRSEGQGLARNRAPEHVVDAAIWAVSARLRFRLPQEEVGSLEAEDRDEEEELLAYGRVAEPAKVEEEGPRESGNAEWKRLRGEDGKGS